MAPDLLKIDPSSRRSFTRQILRKVFLEDWLMKLTALIITFALWFGVTGLSTPTTRRITVPLNVTIANNAEIMNTPQPDIEIVVSGDKRRLDQINRGDLYASLDLTDLAPGDRLISLSPETLDVPLPQGVKLVEVLPSRIVVNLEAVEEREVEVKSQWKGSLPDGYEIYGTTAVPAKIRVRGPVSFMSNLDHVETAPIDITGKTSDFVAKQISVSAGNAKASVLNTVVDVIFRIGEKRVERTLTVAVPGGKNVRVVVYGPASSVAGIKTDMLKVENVRDENGAESPKVTLPFDLQEMVTVRKVTVR